MLSDEERNALGGLAADLGQVFGSRLHSVAAFGLNAGRAASRRAQTSALVERLTFNDLFDRLLS